MQIRTSVAVIIAEIALLIAGSNTATTAQQRTQGMAIATIRADGSNFRILIARDLWLYGSPSYSRDMQTILFDGWPVGLQRDASSVFVASHDGSQVQELAEGQMPRWSASEDTILFHRFDVGVVAMQADGMGAEVLARNGGSPRWSPTDNQIAYLVWGGAIRLHDLRAGSESPLRDFDELDPLAGFCWSPDGSEIAFVARNRGLDDMQYSLLVANVDQPREPLRELATGFLAPNVAWSPDGKSIAFSQSNGVAHPQQIYLIPADGSDAPKRLVGQPTDRSNISASWSPDANSFIFASYRWSDQPTPLDNDRPVPSLRPRDP